MADYTFLGRTTRTLYRFTPRFNAEGQMLSTVILNNQPVTFLDQEGNVLARIQVNGEQATYAQGARDGSVPRGVIGPGFTGPPSGQGQGPTILAPTWAPSDWETNP
jgi:hypothetical protein